MRSHSFHVRVLALAMFWLLAQSTPLGADEPQPNDEPQPATAAAETTDASDAPSPDSPSPDSPSSDAPSPDAPAAEVPAGKTSEGVDVAEPDAKPGTPVRTTPPPGEPLYDLSYKFHAGELIRTRVVHRATVETSIQGTTQTVETRASSIKLWKVNDVRSDGTTFVHSVESVDMWQQTQGHQAVTYNSLTDTEVPDAYKEVAKQVGIPLTVVNMDRNGRVLKREEKLQQANVNSMPLTVVLPGQRVAVGAVWTTPLDFDVRQKDRTISKIKGRYRYHLTKVANDVAVIEVESQVLSLIHDPAIEAQLIQRMPSGTVRFDIDAGRVISQQMDLDKRVIGFSGPSSSIHCLTRLTEELLPAGVETVERLPPVSENKRKPAGTSGKGQPTTGTRAGGAVR